MVHILLLILKVIGILILILLGVFLAAVCLVLFVPVRYEAGGNWKKEPVGRGQVSWLFGAVSLRAGYDGKEKGLTAGFRLFGRQFWELDGGEENGEEPVTPSEEPEKSRYEEIKEPSEIQKAETSWESTGDFEKKDREKEGVLKTEERKTEKKRFEKLKFSFQSFCDKLKHIKETAEKKKAWMDDEKNQASLRLLWRQAGRFLRHVCPQRGYGSVTFGFEDPYLTGQVLSAAALVYPFFEGNMEVCPVFDEKIFEAEGSFKGRIRAGYLLWLGLGVLRDRHTRCMLFGLLK